MPLIPGKLPPGTCYGTPQQMLEIFSQHLSTTGSEQSTLYTTAQNSTPTVVDPVEPYPRIWVDRYAANSPIVKVYGGQTGQNWVQVGAQTLFKQFDSTNTPGANNSPADFLAFKLPPRSVIHWIVYYVGAKFISTAQPSNNVTVTLLLNPNTNASNPFQGSDRGTQIGDPFDVNPTSLVDVATSVPNLPNPVFAKYSAGSEVWAEFGPENSTFTNGLVYIWLNYSQLQG